MDGVELMKLCGGIVRFEGVGLVSGQRSVLSADMGDEEGTGVGKGGSNSDDALCYTHMSHFYS